MTVGHEPLSSSGPSVDKTKRRVGEIRNKPRSLSDNVYQAGETDREKKGYAQSTPAGTS